MALSESEAEGRIDLLTVLAHELEHLLGGNQDDTEPHRPTLSTGIRSKKWLLKIGLISYEPTVSVIAIKLLDTSMGRGIRGAGACLRLRRR